LLRIGQQILVRSLRADGACYRWWHALVEYSDASTLVTYAPHGARVEQPGGGYSVRYAIRAWYWFDRPYNLLEVYEPDGSLAEIYIHIASPPRLVATTLEYTDHELDVVCQPGAPPRIVDQDEFAEAAMRYGYTAAFQAACFATAEAALVTAAEWQPHGPLRLAES
jgi:protein associated with RNAse G/E